MTENDSGRSRSRMSLYGTREKPPAAFAGRRASQGHSHRHAKGRRPRVWSIAWRTAVLGAILGLALYSGAQFMAHRMTLRPAAPVKPHDGPLPHRATDTAMVGVALDSPQARVRRLIDETRQAETLVEECRRMAMRGLQDEAIARLRAQLARTPTNLAVLHALGELLLAQGDGEEAADVFLAALSAQPASPSARLRLGQAFFLQQAFAAALDTAVWVIDMEPSQLEAHRLAARAALREDSPDVALRHIRRMIDLRGDELEAWQMLAVVHLRRGEYGRAIHTLNDIIRQGRATPREFFNLAAAFAQQGQVEDTVDTLATAAVRWQASDVYAWLSAPEFEPVRNDSRFAAIERQLARNLSGAPVALQPPGAERGDRAIGLLPEPDFLGRPVELRAR